jgi:hypothetical protein
MGDSSDNLYELPLHAASTRRQMERSRGRPRTVSKRPRYRQLEREQWLRAELVRHQDEDGLVRATRSGGSTRDVIDAISEEVAREAAGLEWERSHQTPGTRDAERISSRRVRALADLARLQLERRQLMAGDVDLHAAGVQRVVEMFVRRVERVVRDVLPPESAERVVDGWRQAIRGWEDEIG